MTGQRGVRFLKLLKSINGQIGEKTLFTWYPFLPTMHLVPCEYVCPMCTQSQSHYLIKKQNMPFSYILPKKQLHLVLLYIICTFCTQCENEAGVGGGEGMDISALDRLPFAQLCFPSVSLSPRVCK